MPRCRRRAADSSYAHAHVHAATISISITQFNIFGIWSICTGTPVETLFDGTIINPASFTCPPSSLGWSDTTYSTIVQTFFGSDGSGLPRAVSMLATSSVRVSFQAKPWSAATASSCTQCDAMDLSRFGVVLRHALSRTAAMTRRFKRQRLCVTRLTRRSARTRPTKKLGPSSHCESRATSG